MKPYTVGEQWQKQNELHHTESYFPDGTTANNILHSFLALNLSRYSMNIVGVGFVLAYVHFCLGLCSLCVQKYCVWSLFYFSHLLPIWTAVKKRILLLGNFMSKDIIDCSCYTGICSEMVKSATGKKLDSWQEACIQVIATEAKGVSCSIHSDSQNRLR